MRMMCNAVVFENYKSVTKLNSPHMIITYINLHI